MVLATTYTLYSAPSVSRRCLPESHTHSQQSFEGACPDNHEDDGTETATLQTVVKRAPGRFSGFSQPRFDPSVKPHFTFAPSARLPRRKTAPVIVNRKERSPFLLPPRDGSWVWLGLLWLTLACLQRYRSKQ